MITRGVLGTALLIALLILLSGCASNRMTRAELVEAYDEFIQTEKLESMDKITAFRLDGWAELGQKHLIINTHVNRYYLVTLRNNCVDLEHASMIQVHNFGSQLRTKFDAISVPNEMSPKCFIQDIYKITKAQRKQLLALDDPQPDEETS